jgi:hypothetical protein
MVFCLPAAAVAPTGAWQLQAAEEEDSCSSSLPVAGLISSSSGATASAIVSQAVPCPLGQAAPSPSAVSDPVDLAATASQEMFASLLSIRKNLIFPKLSSQKSLTQSIRTMSAAEHSSIRYYKKEPVIRP